MNSKIRKLISEYESRISDCDIILNKILDQKRKIRKINITEYLNNEDYVSLQKDWKHYSAQKQCYIQFVSDLKSELLGEM